MWLRDLIAKDFWLKLFSLAVAILIWVTVSIAIRHEVDAKSGALGAVRSRTFPRLPVLVRSAAADVRHFTVNPSHVGVVVSGEPGTLSKLTEKDVRVTVDLTDVESAQNLRQRVEVATPPGITYVRAVPSDVEIVVPPKP